MCLKLPERTVTMNQFMKTPLPIARCIGAFSKEIEEAHNIELIPYQLTEQQVQSVEHLVQKNYLTDEWNFKK